MAKNDRFINALCPAAGRPAPVAVEPPPAVMIMLIAAGDTTGGSVGAELAIGNDRTVTVTDTAAEQFRSYGLRRLI